MVIVSQSMANIAAIKIKSKELQIPFANLALAFVIEEFLVRISESEFAPYLWIQNAGSFGLECYKRRLVEGPEFFYQKEESIDYVLQMKSRVWHGNIRLQMVNYVIRLKLLPFWKICGFLFR